MAFLEHPKRNVTTKMTHLARDPLYLKQKPYGVDFATDTPTTNHVFEDVEVTIRDARSIKSGFSLDENGFCFLDHPTSAIFDSLKTDPSKVEDYYKEIETLIKFAFPEYSRFDIIDHLLRRRDLGYPGNVAAETKIAQPARLPHSDFSLDGLFLRMKRACPGQESLYSEKEYEIVNVWRVLKGPNNDWPLAMCDYRSIEPGKDSIANDVVSRGSIGENELLHANPKHRWYYLSDQAVDEVIVLRNVDSKGQRARSFHAAFDTGLDTAFPRESIEIRGIAFRK